MPLDMMATPSRPLNSASPEPQDPNARRKLPSGWKIWIRLLPESATHIYPWSSTATPLESIWKKENLIILRFSLRFIIILLESSLLHFSSRKSDLSLMWVCHQSFLLLPLFHFIVSSADWSNRRIFRSQAGRIVREGHQMDEE